MHAVHSTRVADPCKPVPARRPFASLPHDVAADPRLTPTDVAVLVALTYWARAKDHCWPSDRSIGLRVGRSALTVQRRLRHLQSVGLVERIESAENRTGRILRLVWRAEASAPVPGPAPVREPARPRSVPAGPGSGPAGPSGLVRSAEALGVPLMSPMSYPPASPMSYKVERSVKGEASKKSETETAQRQRSEDAAEPSPAPRPVPSSAPIVAEALGSTVPSSTPLVRTPARPPVPGSTTLPAPPVPTPSSAARSQALEWAASDDPILKAEAARRLKPKAPPRPEPRTAEELLARIQENPAHVAAAAEVLARTFDDRKSWNGFHAVARRAFEGGIPAEALTDALRRATDPKARNGGALFMSIVNRWSQ